MKSVILSNKFLNKGYRGVMMEKYCLEESTREECILVDDGIASI